MAAAATSAGTPAVPLSVMPPLAVVQPPAAGGAATGASITAAVSMTSNDTVRMPKWLWKVPLLFVCSWVVFSLSTPVFYPREFLTLYTCLHCSLFVISIGWAVSLSTFIYKRRKGPAGTPGNVKHSDFYYAFIIPAYHENPAVLRLTMETLARLHGAADKYIVMLGMEAREEGVEEKAQQLCSEFLGRFAHVSYALHTLRPGEHAGKGSNVAWAARQLVPVIRDVMRLENTEVILTSMDADTLLCDAYMQDLDALASAMPLEELEQRLFHPYMTFYRTEGLPLLNQVIDQFWAMMVVVASCRPIFHVSNPVSCYSMLFSLIVQCDFWEVGAVGIGEDSHQASRCFLMCDGRFRTHAIQQPFAAQHVRGDGIFDSIKQRLVQSKRHGQGHITIMYSIWRWKISKVSWCRTGHIIGPWFELVIYFPMMFITMLGLPIASVTVRKFEGAHIITQDPFYVASWCWICVIWPMIMSVMGTVLFDEPYVKEFPLAVTEDYKQKAGFQWLWHATFKLMTFLPCQILFFGPTLGSYWDMFCQKEVVYVVADKMA